MHLEQALRQSRLLAMPGIGVYAFSRTLSQRAHNEVTVLADVSQLAQLRKERGKDISWITCEKCRLGAGDMALPTRAIIYKAHPAGEFGKAI